ncbi:DUF4333 domain-containing protein [Ruania rhizosphaerae]|uniref:DUF4333 domain-containing protein n=1 Tax=Ruania rhizosphaerae TaxID=1840413 RepID=UPI00190F2B1F|nr:DUF4333 domain-containing protein [Ruania rhizosphaerae]
MKMTRQILAMTALPLALGLGLVGCSGSATVDEAEVESTTADQLEQMVGTRPNIDCPGDLEAEVGATLQCVLSADGDTDEYAVDLTVTSVEDGVANWDFQVAETPM